MKAWLQLLRAPNLFTVPGDVLAGYLLASGATGLFNPVLALIIIASLFFYGYGLLLNDLNDLAEDRAERPSRPLPSGAVDLRTVRIVSNTLQIAGLLLCGIAGTVPLCIGAAIVLAVTAYNHGMKKIFFAGQANMGLCRGLNVLLGASLAHTFSISSVVGATAIAIYITGVTLLARFETRNPRIPPFIGILIRALIFLQAALCAASRTGWAGWACAAILALVFWPLSRLVGKRFYSS